eukprot:jgi/Chlat1/9114/Chrsp97S09277
MLTAVLPPLLASQPSTSTSSHRLEFSPHASRKVVVGRQRHLRKLFKQSKGPPSVRWRHRHAQATYETDSSTGNAQKSSSQSHNPPDENGLVLERPSSPAEMFIQAATKAIQASTGQLLDDYEVDEEDETSWDSPDLRDTPASVKKKEAKQRRVGPLNMRYHKPTARDKLYYTLDKMYSSSPYNRILLLLLVTCTLVFAGAWAYFTSGAGAVSVPEALWNAWLFLADPGTQSEVEANPKMRVVAFVLTVLGMLNFAVLIGLVGEAINAKVQQLDAGFSDVVETGHTLILGWSSKIIPLVKELCVANESEGGRTVVVMSSKPKREMELLFRRAVPDTLGSTVVCRQGDVLQQRDLNLVSASHARSIVVLASLEEANESDAQVIRVALGLNQLKNRKGHVVVEILDLDNIDVLKLGSDILPLVSHDLMGRLMVQCIFTPGIATDSEFYFREWPELTGCKFSEVLLRFPDAVVAGIFSGNGDLAVNADDDRIIEPGDRIIVIAEDDSSYKPAALCCETPEDNWRPTNQCVQSHHLAAHFATATATPTAPAAPKSPAPNLPTPNPTINGADVVESNLGDWVWPMFQNPTVEHADQLPLMPAPQASQDVANEVCRPVYTPDGDSLFQPRLVSSSPEPHIIPETPLHHARKQVAPPDWVRDPVMFQEMAEDDTVKWYDPQNVLICGWRRDVEDMILLLDGYLAKGSEIVLMTPLSVQQMEARLHMSGFYEQGLNNCTLRLHSGNPLQRLISKAWSILLQAVMVLVDETWHTDFVGSDSRSLFSTLLIRDIQERRGRTNSILVNEIKDERTKSMVQVARSNDFVHFSELTSMALGMVSENIEMYKLLRYLFEPVGCEIYIKPVVPRYASHGERLSFLQLVKRARLLDRPEVVIGYKLKHDKSQGPFLNPPDKMAQITWLKGDTLVVLSEYV